MAEAARDEQAGLAGRKPPEMLQLFQSIFGSGRDENTLIRQSRSSVPSSALWTAGACGHYPVTSATGPAVMIDHVVALVTACRQR
jgi:hypothetical protein